MQVKKFLYLLFIFILIIVVGIGIYYKNNGNYIEKNIIKIIRARNTIKDKYSLNVFDSYMKWLTDKTPFDKSFEEEPYIESLNPITNPKAGDYCIDAGISKDAMSPLFDFAELVGDRGKIFAFEPDYTIHKYINKEIEERGYKNIKLYSYGIWNEKTKIKFYMQECSSSAVRKVIEDPEYITANFIDIDSFMEENKIERMDVIKMDIEGAEINAIKGAEKTIKKYKPNLIIALYHRKDDAINIINIVHKMNPNYEIFLCYHYPFDYPEDWTEIRNIMLYAIDKNKKKTSK